MTIEHTTTEAATTPVIIPATDPRWTATNRDVKRRDALLGIVTDNDPDDVTHFHGLTAEKLATLVSEGFAPVGCRQNNAPTTAVFLAFVQEYPETHAFGYAVHPAREDYRITIEGVAVALERVPEARRQIVRSAFCEAFRGADEFVDSVGVLYAWWD